MTTICAVYDGGVLSPLLGQLPRLYQQGEAETRRDVSEEIKPP